MKQLKILQYLLQKVKIPQGNYKKHHASQWSKSPQWLKTLQLKSFVALTGCLNGLFMKWCQKNDGKKIPLYAKIDQIHSGIEISILPWDLCKKLCFGP